MAKNRKVSSKRSRRRRREGHDGRPKWGLWDDEQVPKSGKKALTSIERLR